MTDSRYPVSNDVKRLNPDLADTLVVGDLPDYAQPPNTFTTSRKGNPASALIYLTPDKLRQLKEAIGAKPESEAEFQSWVIDLAKARGYKVAHFRGGWSKDGKRFNTPIIGDPGFFDVILAKNGVTIIAEIKSEKGKLSPGQKEWFDAMNGDGVATTMVFVFRPGDRHKIEALLK